MQAVAGARPSILVVEDEAIVAMDLENSLSSLGYRIAGVASSRDEALALAERTAPDLVLMDIKLDGEFDGIAAANEIRQRWQIPVVFLTAYASDEVLARARTAGAYGYLVKPFRGCELNAVILMALNQQRLASELFAEHAWLRTVLGSLSDGVIATDAEGRVRYLNHSAEVLLGWLQAEALDRPVEEVFRVKTLGGAPVESCQLRRALGQTEPVGKQRFLLITRSGRKVPVEDSASAIVKDGQVLGAVAVLTDIRARLLLERRQAKQHLRLKEQVETAAAALGQKRTELQALSRHLMTAQEEERRRVARELHDDLGQQTALLGLALDRLRQLVPQDTDEVQEALA
jgi:PAS domain S-box-containing protein